MAAGSGSSGTCWSADPCGSDRALLSRGCFVLTAGSLKNLGHMFLELSAALRPPIHYPTDTTGPQQFGARREGRRWVRVHPDTPAVGEWISPSLLERVVTAPSIMAGACLSEALGLLIRSRMLCLMLKPGEVICPAFIMTYKLRDLDILHIWNPIQEACCKSAWMLCDNQIQWLLCKCKAESSPSLSPGAEYIKTINMDHTWRWRCWVLLLIDQYDG